MKQCSTCKQVQPLSSFYSRKGASDGLRSQCKSCHIESTIRTRDPAIHRAAVRRYTERLMATNPEKLRERRRRRKHRPYGPKQRARLMLQRAAKKGLVTRPAACERCGAKGRIHGHHHDYAKPLDVLWLCPACHVAEHMRLRGEVS